MLITTERVGETSVARPVGRVDHTAAAQFESALMGLVPDAQARRAALVVDASELDYISSVGLRVLMIVSKQLHAWRAPLILAAPRPLVAEILAISRFDRVLSLAPTLDEALTLASPQGLADYRAAHP